MQFMFQYSQLAKTELQTAKVLGLDESCALKLLTNKPIKVRSRLV